MEKGFKIYFILIASFVFGVSVIRAFNMQITIDEAITYLSFVRGKWSLSTELLANNHLLNTILIMLITFITKVSFNEFLIRIPNLVFYLIYIIYVYKLSCLYGYKGTVATILLLNYSVGEFASVARGYCIASAFAVLGLYYYKLYLKDKQIKNLKTSILHLILSCFASSTNLILVGAFLLDFVTRMIKEKQLKNVIIHHKRYFFGMIIVLLLLLSYHFYVCFSDQYLGMCNKDLFSCIVYSPVKYYGASFMFSKVMIIIMLIVSIIFVLFRMKQINLSEDNLCYMILIIYFILIVCKLVFPFNLPSGRTLIPFFSVYIVSIIDFASLVSNKFFSRYCGLLIIVLCFISFFKNLNVSYVREWKVEDDLKSLVYQRYKEKGKISLDEITQESYVSLLFYYEKYRKLYSYSLISTEDYYNILHENQVHPMTS